MRMRALMRTGGRLLAASGAAWLAATLADLPVAWVNAVYLPLFLAGVIDVAIALGFRARMDDMVRGMAELSAAGRRMSAPLPQAGALAEKRLAYREAGVEFPTGPAYSWYDRRGVLQAPFPVHFRTVPPARLIDGVRIEEGVMETHSDPDHDGCPECETWRREHGR